jgi:uncharacterized membrane protein YcaP (DUF421 family)
MDTPELLPTAGRVVLIYFFILLVIRLLGKREVGNITAFDLITALMIGETVDEMFFGKVPLLPGLVAISTIALLHFLNSWLSTRSPFIDRLTGAPPTTLIQNGVLNKTALRHERMSIEELASQLRMEGVEDVKEVKRATLEPSGHVSVIRKSKSEA